MANLLKKYGYNSIELPQADYKPLQMMVQGKSFQPIGPLKSLLVQGDVIPYPTLSKDIPSANVEGQKARELNLGMGLKLLNGILQKFGATKGAGFDAAFKGAKTLVFTYHNVLADKVAIIDLDKYVNDAEVDKTTFTYGEKLKDSEIFVINEVLKSASFSIEAMNENGQHIELNIPEIEDNIEGNINFRRDASKGNKVFFEGETALAFAFKAVHLKYKKRGWFSKKDAGYHVIPAGARAVLSEEDVKADFLELSDEAIIFQASE